MKSPLSNFIITFTAVAVVLSGYVFWYSTITAKSIAVAFLQSQITATTGTASRAASARAALASISDDEATIRSYFVPETGVVSFIDELEARGRSLGSTVSVLSVSKADTSSQSSLALSLGIKGSFDAVVRTVGAIEYAPYELSILEFSLGQDQKDNKQDVVSSWHANLKLRVGSMPADTETNSNGSNVLETTAP